MAVAYGPALDAHDDPSLDPTERAFVPSGGGSPPVSCAITLTGANAGTYGMTAADIDGQRFYKATTATGTNYFVNSTDNTSFWGTGRRWIECTSYVPGANATATHGGIINAATGVGLALQAATSTGTTSRAILLYDFINGTTTATQVIANGTGAVGLGIDGSTGDCYYDLGAGAVALTGAFVGAFSGAATVVLAGRINGSTPNPGDMTFVTAASSFAAVSSDSDYCGNAV